MAQRQSGYVRRPRDDYSTPQWVVDELFQRETFPLPIWEPCPGEGRMVKGIAAHVGLDYVFWSYDDFFQDHSDVHSIITNPPFKDGQSFVQHALNRTKNLRGKVAMLLPNGFDCAKGKKRRALFSDEAPFKVKYVLTQRIRWENLEQKKNGPSNNHAWYVWDWAYGEEPRIWWI